MFIGRALKRPCPFFDLVGKPVLVEKNENPTQEDIQTLQDRYVAALQELFEENKEKYEPNQSVNLVIH